MTLITLSLTVEDFFSPGGGGLIKTPGRRRRSWNCELIELECSQLGRNHVRPASLVSETGASSDWIFIRVIQASVKKRPLSSQFKICHIRVPVSYGTPAAAPRVKVHASHAKSRWYQRGCRLAVWPKGFAVEV